MLEARTFRFFIALAEELHFGRAADRLGIAPSVLSLQIKRLEDVLGTQLVERNRRAAVLLTRAGRTFLSEARSVLNGIERAENIGRAAGRLEAGPIRIGYIFSAAFSGALSQLLVKLDQHHPLLEIELVPMETPRQIEALAAGSLDLGLIRSRPSYDRGLSVRLAQREALVLAFGHRHRLASLSTVCVADLSGERFIVPQLAERSDLAHALGELRRLGCGNIEMISTGDFLSGITMAASGLGVVLAPASLERLGIEGACFAPIAGFAGSIDLLFAHRNDDFGFLADMLCSKDGDPDGGVRRLAATSPVTALAR